MYRVKIPAELKHVSSIFSQHGFEAFLVGGAVRDMLLKKEAKDWDLATNAQPQDVIRMFKHVIPTGIEHGTVTVLYKNHHIEVTTYRIEEGYSDGRRPDAVQFASGIEEDLSRRDFTMNAIAASLIDGSIIDPFDGRSDIKRKLIRTVGRSEERFFEDGLRPIRSIRFASQLGFSIDELTLEAIPIAIGVTKGVAIERFRDEFVKILATEKPSAALLLMEDTGLLKYFFPELYACRGVMQGGFHSFDVLDHSLLACDAAPSNSLVVRLAALFHDVGKAETQKPAKLPEEITELSDDIEQKYTFYNHEAVSASQTQQILERLRFSNKVVTDTVHLVRQHMFHYEDNWSDAAVRRFLVRIEADSADAQVLKDLFDLRRADMFGMNGQNAPPQSLLPFRYRIEDIFANDAALSLKSLAVNGRDLLAEKLATGKHIGYILQQLLEAVLEDPSLNTKEKLLQIAKNISEALDKN